MGGVAVFLFTACLVTFRQWSSLWKAELAAHLQIVIVVLQVPAGCRSTLPLCKESGLL